MTAKEAQKKWLAFRQELVDEFGHDKDKLALAELLALRQFALYGFFRKQSKAPKRKKGAINR